MHAVGTIAASPSTQKAQEKPAEEHLAQVDSSNAPATSAPTFQEAIQRLQLYWAGVGCAVLQPSSTEVGAGTMNPATFLRVLGPEPWSVAYVEPSIRPDDSRYGENPNRVQRHTQFQVILKPDPGRAQELYLGSLAALGIDTRQHDVRFVEDNWESPVLGAWGLGWEVWLNGMEITQFTYFQQCGSLPLSPVSVEITYGLERIIMSLQGVDHFKKILYSPGVTYGELFLDNEREMSQFNLEVADVERARQRFELYEAEARAMVERGLPIPAYDHVLKTSHVFNLLDARGAVGVTERARFFGRMRWLARECAQLWVKTREELGFPLGQWEEAPQPAHPLEAQPQAGAAEDRTFVLEIGSEELPPDDVSSGVRQLEAAVPALLQRSRLRCGAIQVYGTPRRLAVVVEQLAAAQPDVSELVRGPPKAKAIAEDGQPTKAAQGFCKKNGVAVEDLIVRADEKGVEYAYAQVKTAGRPAAEVLAQELPTLIASLAFLKTMKWNSQVAYSRPIRWIVALHGDAVLPFLYAGLASGRVACALRASQNAVVQIPSAEDYLSTVAEAGITLDMQARRDAIWERGCTLAEQVGGALPSDARGALLSEVANLVEAPVPLLGRFDERFLELPSEVLVTVMKKHQRYFPVEDARGAGGAAGGRRLLPAFIAVPNGRLDEACVRAGNEAVLRARYEDAKFFYDADAARPLGTFREQLGGITFQEKLGSMLDKSRRVEAAVPPLARLLGLGEAALAVAANAVKLAGADLATSLVMEFTSLAGLMGRHYAAREGQSPEVAEAIFESVLPRFAGDQLPRSDPGILLSVADRLDSLVGLFAVGCEPTANADQFGLRRSAYALVQALVENSRMLDLKEALPVVAGNQPLPVDSAVLDQVLTFITRRLEQLLVDRGARVEFVRAVLAERGSVPALAAASVQQLEEVAGRGELEPIVSAYARPFRIARKNEVDPSWQVDESKFVEEEERVLWAAYQEVTAVLHPRVSIDTFVSSSKPLSEPLDRFFANVFVMAEDAALRRNRLALLRDVAALPRGVVDLSLLPGF